METVLLVATDFTCKGYDNLYNLKQQRVYLDSL